MVGASGDFPDVLDSEELGAALGGLEPVEDGEIPEEFASNEEGLNERQVPTNRETTLQ